MAGRSRRYALTGLVATCLALGGCLSVPDGVVAANEAVTDQIRTLEHNTLQLLDAYETAARADLRSEDMHAARMERARAELENRCASAPEDNPSLCAADEAEAIAVLYARRYELQSQGVAQTFDELRQRFRRDFAEPARINGEIQSYLEGAQKVVTARRGFVSRINEVTDIDMARLGEDLTECLGSEDPLTACRRE